MFRQALGLTRSFSTSAAMMAKSVKPPIQLFGVQGRYANALYSAASQKNKLPVVEKDLATFKGFTETDVKFNNFLNDPILSRSVKKDVIEKTLKKQKFDEISVNFFGVLADNNRLKVAGDIVDAFQSLMVADRGEVAATITTAKALSGKHKKSIEKSLNGFLQKGQKHIITYNVDANIMGGLVVEMGDRLIDMSVKAKLANYKKLLSESL
eukprot:m.8018 g.8018  ORF g.8018 m.8018 type:complete len:210 (+) comp5986_c0_seq1:20-649(+)